MKYLTTIGLEVHVQLKTQSKLFCGCSTEYGAPPNTHVCPVCLGYPGVLPVVNEQAIRLTVITGLMIGSKTNYYSKFDRKSYFYPDMPKNYQISQYDEPLCVGGSIDIEVGGKVKTVGIIRVHLEEDVAKSMHFQNSSGIDFNRAGIPLMEIVSKPDLNSPEEAFAYLLSLKRILLYAGVSDCNLEEGNIRCDVNSSIRLETQKELGTKTEIKNLNTFKGVLNALKYETTRQIEILESGGTIDQETRRWDVDTGVTIGMRSKEYAHDYRYFPEPDLTPVVLSREQVAEWQRSLPELPRDRRKRLMKEYRLPEYDAGVLSADMAVADYFEAAARLSSNPKAVSNWIMTEMMRLLSETGVGIKDIPITAKALADLIKLVDDGIVNLKTAKEIFAIMFEKGKDPNEIVKEKELAQISDYNTIEKLVNQAMRENPKSVTDYKKGKKAAAQFLIGQVMRLSKGKADPQVIGKLLKEKLKN